jgi:hypothetical protein
MHVVEIFLPLERGDGLPVEAAEIHELVTMLAERFGGATAFTRAPASGLWETGGDLQADRIVIVEVMVGKIDDEWWRNWRIKLERQFQQERILIRATETRPL